jgi:cytochrome bd ubiquinol oxidase subunit II
MMETVWFILVAFMITAYVVLDGFDLGAGVLHLLIARNDDERRMIRQSIGPVWDGNEVWLIAGGGTLFFAFPLLYASSFSGFYLPLNIVLWLLILRAIGIEFRAHAESPVWRELFDIFFAGSSALLTIFFGAALGNVIRGVSLGTDHYFFAPLWTNWRVGPDPGILDWYTVIAALLALVALSLHGALYLALKTPEPLATRSRQTALLLWPALLILTIASLLATVKVRPEILANFRNPLAWIVPAIVLLSLAAMPFLSRKQRDMHAFLASCAYLVAMLAGAAVALYPNVLPSSTDPRLNLTIYNTATGHHSLTAGLFWWIPGIFLAIAYFVFIYRMFAGRVQSGSTGHY